MLIWTDFITALGLILPVILKLPKSVPGLVIETIVQKDNHFLAHFYVNDSICFHSVHKTKHSSNLCLIRVLLSIRFQKSDPPGVVPCAPLITVTFSKELAHVFFCLVLQISHQKKLAFHCNIPSNFLLLRALYQILQQAHLYQSLYHHVIETPSGKFLIAIGLHFDLLFHLIDFVAHFFNSFACSIEALFLVKLLFVATQLLVLELDYKCVSSHIFLLQ